jgi:predicted nucleotidyltransferase
MASCTFKHRLVPAGAGLGLRVHPQLLRHRFAVHLLRGGADLRCIATLMGHPDPAITAEGHARLVPSDLRVASNAKPEFAVPAGLARSPPEGGGSVSSHGDGHGYDAIMPLALDIDRDRLAQLCRRYRVAKLELFGSRAKGTARPDSDVDLLVTFEGRTPGFAFVTFADELEAIFGRKVDLLIRETVEADENPIRRDSILSVIEPFYAA